ncbi:hypothetical protein WA026_005846 [Henosepilachna vigintioctopunctata]|uniref:Transposase n=1 Tax=Henosepilachna vigintioctopunctata TaxID=420089 RepID=A0AAW1U309_9CUCU
MINGFLPTGRTINEDYNKKVKQRLREAMRRTRSELWKKKTWILHHDNAPANTAMLVRDCFLEAWMFSPNIHACSGFFSRKQQRSHTSTNDFMPFPKLGRPM